MGDLSVPVFGLDIVCESLRLLIRSVVAVTVVVIVIVGMIIGLGTNVVELDDVAALETALNRAVTGDGQPVDNMGVGRVASATGVLLIASSVDKDGVLQRSLAGSIKRLHIEHVNAPHLSEQFQSLKTGSLLEITGNLTGLTSGGKEVIFGLHLFVWDNLSRDLELAVIARHGRGKRTSFGESPDRGALGESGGGASSEHCC